MTQHTETATPIALKFKSGNGVPVESVRITAEEWQAVERELAALQAQVDALTVNIRALTKHGDTLRTQLAQAQSEATELRQLVQKLGEAVCIAVDYLPQHWDMESVPLAQVKTAADEFLSGLHLPNSAEGEDDTHLYGGGSDPYSRK